MVKVTFYLENNNMMVDNNQIIYFRIIYNIYIYIYIYIQRNINNNVLFDLDTIISSQKEDFYKLMNNIFFKLSEK